MKMFTFYGGVIQKQKGKEPPPPPVYQKIHVNADTKEQAEELALTFAVDLTFEKETELGAGWK